MADTTLGQTAPDTSLPVSKIESHAETLALLGSGALSEISALCTLSLAAMERPGTFHLESMALCLQIIRTKADDISNCIDYEAEQINISLTCPRAEARRAARRAVNLTQTTTEA